MPPEASMTAEPTGRDDVVEPDWDPLTGLADGRWIELEGLANLRDLGGLSTSDGRRVQSKRLLRSDNLQTLTAGDIEQLLGLGLSDVVDLRSNYEVESEGPGPLRSHADLAFHHLSFFVEPAASQAEADTGGAVLPEAALPWIGLTPAVQVDDFQASTYLSFLADRPDSVLGALRAIAYADGAALVHCAAGKDRTGTVVALALALVGVDRQQILDDYAASNERIEAIVARLMATKTYHANLVGRPMSSHATNPQTMEAMLRYVETTHGGVEPLLASLGWTADDTAAMRRKLLDDD